MSNLSSQFNNVNDIEEQQRRRFRRKREYGFVGNGYWWANYPYVYGTMGTGGNMTSTHERGETPEQETAEQHDAEAMGASTKGILTTGITGETSDGGGMGGTAASATGAAGGMPA